MTLIRRISSWSREMTCTWESQLHFLFHTPQERLGPTCPLTFSPWCCPIIRGPETWTSTDIPDSELSVWSSVLVPPSIPAFTLLDSLDSDHRPLSQVSIILWMPDYSVRLSLSEYILRKNLVAIRTFGLFCRSEQQGHLVSWRNPRESLYYFHLFVNLFSLLYITRYYQ